MVSLGDGADQQWCFWEQIFSKNCEFGNFCFYLSRIFLVHICLLYTSRGLWPKFLGWKTSQPTASFVSVDGEARFNVLASLPRIPSQPLLLSDAAFIREILLLGRAHKSVLRGLRSADPFGSESMKFSKAYIKTRRYFRTIQCKEQIFGESNFTAPPVCETQ